MLTDIKYAIRQLWKNPSFSIVAILSLAVGISVNDTTFGFVNTMVLQPVQRNESMRLASIYSVGRQANRNYRSFSYGEFEALNAAQETFNQVAAYTYTVAAVGRIDNAKRSFVGLVSENYFPLLNVRPSRGRFFSSEESQPHAGIPVAVATLNLWERLGRPDNFVGSTVLINSQPFTVIGITPSSSANLGEVGPEVWLPLGVAQRVLAPNPGAPDIFGPPSHLLSLIGAFRPGVTLENVSSHVPKLNNILNEPPLGNPRAPRDLVLTLPPRFSLNDSTPKNESFLTPFALTASVLALIVLLVASMNLANMVLARGVTRQREIAIRIALGASRWRVVRLLLAESVLLAVAGGGAGLFLSRISVAYLERITISDFSSGLFTHASYRPLDWADVAVTALLSTAAMALFGLLPALRLTRSDLVNALKQQAGEPGGGNRVRRFFAAGNLRMMGQIALSFVLLFSGALFIRAAQAAIGFDPGFDKAGSVVVNLEYLDPGQPGSVVRRQQALVATAQSIPGVSSVALASAVPFNFETTFRQVYSVESTAPDAEGGAVAVAPRSVITSVSSGYFRTLRIPFTKGRDFTEQEAKVTEGNATAIIDESLARALFQNTEPLGRYVTVSRSDLNRPDRRMQIIGVVRGSNEEVFEAAAPHRIYTPLGLRPTTNTYLHVGLAPTASTNFVLDQLRRRISALEPNTPILSARLVGDLIDRNVYVLAIRLAALVFGGAGLVALLLALIGVYGSKMYVTVRRTREFGIRMALGATRETILVQELKLGALQAAAGLSVGLALAAGAGIMTQGMLYHVQSFDPLALLVTGFLLSLSLLLACYLPARRATTIDPAITLKAE